MLIVQNLSLGLYECFWAMFQPLRLQGVLLLHIWSHVLVYKLHISLYFLKAYLLCLGQVIIWSLLLWNKQGYVIFISLFFSSLKDDMLIIDSLQICLQVNEIVLLSFDKSRSFLRLLLKLVLGFHQVSLELVQTCIVNVAHFHFRKRG